MSERTDAGPRAGAPGADAPARPEGAASSLRISEITDLDFAKRALQGLNAKLRAVRQELAEVTKDRDALLEDFEAVSDGFEEQEEALGQLQGKYREMAHRDKFRELARSRGVDGDMIDDLYMLSGYEPDSDDPDEPALVETIERLRREKPRYFAPDPKSPPAGAGDRLALGPLPDGSSTGGRQAAPGSRGAGLTVSRGQLADPNFAIAHSAAVQAAHRDGTLTLRP